MGYYDSDEYDRHLRYEFNDDICKSCGHKAATYMGQHEHMDKAHPLTNKLIGTDTDFISQVMSLLEAVIRKTEGTDWTWTP